MHANRDRRLRRKAMPERLADSLMDLVRHGCFSSIDVAMIAAKTGLSRKSFYYHFSDLDHLIAWALSQEMLNSDRRGNSFMALAAQAEPPAESETVSRSLSRVCLLLDRGGMGAVFDVALDAQLALWTKALCPEGELLPDEVVAQLEYAVGGTVGMLSRAGRSSDSKRRASMAFVHERHLWMVRRVAEVLGESPRSVAARLERVRRAAVA